MTIIEKVTRLLKSEKCMSLKELYNSLPEHTPASIRGNINRYLSSEKEHEFQRIEKGMYSIVEVCNINTNEDGTKTVNFISHFYKNDESIHCFNKDFMIPSEFNFDIEDGIYSRTENFDSFEKFMSATNEIQGILYDGDVKKFLKRIKSNSVHMILTDPPYKKISGGTGSKNSPSGILSKNDGKIFDFNDINFNDYIPDCFRILKPDSHAYFFTDFTNLFKMADAIMNAGFKIHNLLVWQKNNATPNRWYMKNNEYIIFCRKGKAKAINDKGSKTVHLFDNIIGNKIHPTEKPIDLLKMYISNSTNEGDWICDPFGGSFSTGCAALLLKRKIITGDIDKSFIQNGIERLKMACFENKDCFAVR